MTLYLRLNKDIGFHVVKKQVYVQLLNEGSPTYRPVEAVQISANVYQLIGHDIYDPEDEEWEFEPGTRVRVEEQELGMDPNNQRIYLVAIESID